ncbi:MAG: hypothetical protein HUU49_01775 [Candidatus Buchananbacteria bacterium]|nr:hypothetical protein [Candidatus Buchananbacteria bacterium]
MTGQNSILDKIIESQEKQQAASFNLSELVNSLLKNLSSKESDILSRRFGLMGREKETLEQIGKYYNITRERIRQIETATIKKLAELKELKGEVDSASQYVTHLLENHGGVMEEKFLLDKISQSAADEQHQRSSQFILNHLLRDKIEGVKPDADVLPGYKLPVVSLDVVKAAIKELVEMIDQQKKLLTSEEILDSFRNSNFYLSNKDQITALKLGTLEENEDIDNIIHSFLRIAKRVDQNILGEWGLNNWNTVKPKRMSDKVYLVLKKHGKPLHFTDITNLINQEKFDKKIAYPATIHNELILDDRYVLVGRGIYALQEWGYKPGTVIDTIIEILTKAGKPMTKEEIVKAVLDQRMVRKSTIYLALTNKDKIKKLPDGRYTIN